MQTVMNSTVKWKTLDLPRVHKQKGFGNTTTRETEKGVLVIHSATFVLVTTLIGGEDTLHGHYILLGMVLATCPDIPVQSTW